MHLNADLEVELESKTKSTIDFMRSLILWNDDHNTFDHVIACLVKYVGKTESEASEIAYIVLTKGWCIILEGSKAELVECYHILKLKDLTVSIE